MYVIDNEDDRDTTDMNTVRDRIIEHFRSNPGVNPHFKTLGTNWTEAQAIFTQLKAEGVLVERIVPSKTGRKITKLFLDEAAL